MVQIHIYSLRPIKLVLLFLGIRIKKWFINAKSGVISILIYNSHFQKIEHHKYVKNIYIND